jgi:preprotein translocase subunit SecD
MKEFTFRTVLIIGVFALSFYLLYPTFADIQNSKDISAKLVKLGEVVKQKNPTLSETDYQKKITSLRDSLMKADPSIIKNREKRIKLGLDLQGGMYLVMEINTAKMLEKLAKNPDELFYKLLAEADNETKVSEENVVQVLARKIKANGKRMSMYFDFGDITASDSDIESKLQQQEKDAVSRAVEVISKRVNQYGVSEPEIQSQGSRRIILQLPGISNMEEARNLVQKGAVLEFKLFPKPEIAFNVMKKIDQALAGADSSSAGKGVSNSKDNPEQFAKQHPFFNLARTTQEQQTADTWVKSEDRDKINNFLAMPEIKKIVDDAAVSFVFDSKPLNQKDGDYYILHVLNAKPELTGEVVVNATAHIDQTENKPMVNMEMNDEGAQEWARITGQNVGQRCAIVLDGVVYSAPNIIEKIPGGQSRISGSSTMEEAKLLEIVLKAGALPAPVVPIEERIVGPSLGQDSVTQGLNSGIYGFIVVTLFMLIYYRNGGFVAFAGLFFTILISLAVLAAFKGVLTLPGIAGVVLSIGMAVDSNVLIYERIREELGVGKTLRAAIDSGFEMSFSAIFDSNITTLITGIVLYQFGTGPIQGFALTLMIGIAASLFSALVFSRLIFDYFVSKGQMIKLG